MPVDSATIKSIFLSAAEIAGQQERHAYLSDKCAGDPLLRQRVEALLTAHEESGEFRDFTALAASGTAESAGKSLNAGTEQEEQAQFTFLSPPTQPNHLGRLGHYQIQSLIGQGGMGMVFKAFDETLDRIVAVKVLAPHHAANAAARRRFVREAKAIAAVVHEHVVAVHAVAEA